MNERGTPQRDLAAALGAMDRPPCWGCVLERSCASALTACRPFSEWCATGRRKLTARTPDRKIYKRLFPSCKRKPALQGEARADGDADADGSEILRADAA